MFNTSNVLVFVFINVTEIESSSLPVTTIVLIALLAGASTLAALFIMLFIWNQMKVRGRHSESSVSLLLYKCRAYSLQVSSSNPLV